MEDPKDGISEALKRSFNLNRQQHRLELSNSDELQALESQVAKRQAYGKEYWKKYKTKKKRIFGTLPVDVYQALVVRAEAHDKTPWQLIWAEAKAYRNQVILPTQEIAILQRQLLGELRHIGNNFNQLTRLAHIQSKQMEQNENTQNPEHLISEILRQFQKLETKIQKFDEGIDEQLNLRPKRRSSDDDH